ncbi:ABC transporter permease [Fulvivirga lutimaris]|uniref:ABC transporter permease n=1 Tax=Fulvivirga lutimaris TaxID=1819566 RepID=UPI0012BD3F9E|nr:ABC transporter permease [Fulvivirga lutimaris]MTI40163.1 FtsX-like permease family protein [Fulvivirga lutimaris]
MLKNIFKISLRIFIKERFYSFINVLGLALGVASCLIIAQYTTNELTYDTHHPEVEQIYRVNQTNFWAPEGGVMGSTVLPLAEALKTEFPQIKATCRINTPYAKMISAGGSSETFLEENILGADSTFFDFFGFKLQEGNPKTALDEINTVVITSEMAQKYFGQESALGKTILYGDDKKTLEVTGVLAPNQQNAHFDFDFLISIYTNQDCKRFEWSWIWTQVVTYVKVEGDIQPIQTKLNEIADKYALSAFRRLGIEFDEFEKEKGELTFYLQPVTDIHLRSGSIDNRIGTDGNIVYIQIFGIVGFVILLLACINFINLSTARAGHRAKEIGLKKVLGSSKKQLVGQLLFESLLISIIATGVGLGLTELFKIGMLNFLGIEIESVFSVQTYSLIIILFPIIVGFIAGAYPALYLTQFKPVSVMKGQFTSGKGSARFRNGLVVFQFSIAICLMICTTIIYQQLNYFQNSNMGFTRDNMIVINEVDQLDEQTESFFNQVKQLSGVNDVIVSSVVPGFGNPEDLMFIKGNPDRKVSLGTIKVNESYIPGLGMELVAGRNFDKMQDETHNIVINEMTAESFGWTPEEAIGKSLVYYEPEFNVIGVVKNFHSLPLYYEIAPLALFDFKAPIFNASQNVLVSVNGTNTMNIIEDLEKTWNGITNTVPFNYNFLDQQLADVYKSEDQLSKLFVVFTSLAMIIAGIGLFGLSAFVATRRNKEMGIRKVLGASASQLVMMINTKFSTLILLSCLIAAPLAWWLMQQWLTNFIYHVDIEVYVMVMCITMVLIFTWLTAGYQSLKAALTNPVDVLKDE